MSKTTALFALLALCPACRHADTPGYLSTSYDRDSTGIEPDATAGTPTTETPVDTTPPVDETPPAPAFTAGPGGIPLPPDAVQNTQMPPAGGKMTVYEVPRARVAVGDELKANLTADGWSIDSEETSPRFNALRLKVSKDGAKVDVRVSGDDTKAGIIITTP